MRLEQIVVKCPECGELIGARFLDRSPYCPYCGLIFVELERIQEETRRVWAEAANRGRAA